MVSEDPRAWAYALQGLDLALQRHDEVRRQRDPARAYSSAVEAVWWVCACDEQLSGDNRRSPYAVKRDADDDGRVVEGLRWVRDRHTHQLPVTSGLVLRDFRGEGPRYVSSAMPVWSTTESVRTDEGHDARKPHLRKAYADHVADRDTLAVLRQAQRWLQRSTWSQGA